MCTDYNTDKNKTNLRLSPNCSYRVDIETRNKPKSKKRKK